jgi:hypothetical protein
MFGAVLNRLATSVRRALSQYAVGANEPELALNFIDNEYITNNSTSTFASAVTHARAGNATMTDGYGPELVVNGGFASDSDWTKGTGWSIANGVATKSPGTSANLDQTMDVVTGTMYEVSLSLSGVSAGSATVYLQGSATENVSSAMTSSGVYTFLLEAGTASSYDLRINASSTFAGSIDNVSVREMPVIKWAPHNLLTYSEDFTNAAWSKLGDAPAVTANYGTAPDGTSTADRIQFDSTTSGNSTIQSPTITITNGAKYKFSVWMRSLSGNVDVTLFNVGSVTTVSVTSDWQLFTYEATSATTGSQVRIAKRDIWGTSGTADLLVWGAHLYRSDLGGMVDNPDRGDSYVPTTSAAKYLPRIGHHVYNGSAWVNEGVLAESEARTNLTPYSNEFDHSTSWVRENTTVTPDDAVSPSGNQDASKIAETTTADTFRFVTRSQTESAGNYTFSAYLKKETRDYAVLTIRADGGSKRNAVKFNLADGTFVEQRTTGTPSNALYGIQDVGNGWYRCYVSITHTSGSLVSLISPNAETNSGSGINFEYVGDGSSGIYAYQAQTEAGLTPSSLIPTSGSSVSRAAETFTIPSANLPWPEPQYIGSELVTNGTFDTDSDWTKGTGWTISGGVASRGAQSGSTACDQAISLVAGKVYSVTYTLNSLSGGNFQTRLLGGTQQLGPQRTSAGTYEDIFVALSGNNTVRLVATAAGTVVEVDNVSVREINPLSVSIGMEGRMTYADEGGNTATFSRWREDSDNYITHFLYTTGSETGEINIFQRALGTTTQTTSASQYQPDILVPYNIASRHGSTFLNLAKEGVGHTAITTPTALPDLSSTDLNLAYDYMGTISEFRVWDRDITDDGLVEATNPSLEPSLSLTFEGTGTNSFVVNNWSE